MFKLAFGWILASGCALGFAPSCAGPTEGPRQPCKSPGQPLPGVLPVTSCKPSAPLEVELRVLAFEPAGVVDLEYSMLPRIELELLAPEFGLRGGAELLEHYPCEARLAQRGERLTGRLRLVLPADGAARGAALEVIGCLSLPQAESPGGAVVQRASAVFGYPASSAVTGVVAVRSQGVLSLDIPALQQR